MVEKKKKGFQTLVIFLFIVVGLSLISLFDKIETRRSEIAALQEDFKYLDNKVERIESGVREMINFFPAKERCRILHDTNWRNRYERGFFDTDERKTGSFFLGKECMKYLEKTESKYIIQ